MENRVEPQETFSDAKSEGLALRMRIAELEATMGNMNRGPASATTVFLNKHCAGLDEFHSVLATCKEHMLKNARLIISPQNEAKTSVQCEGAPRGSQEKDDTSVGQETGKRVELEEVLRTFWAQKEMKWQESVHNIQKECCGLLGKWEKERSKLKAQEEESQSLERRLEGYKIENGHLRAENSQLVKSNADMGIVIIERDREIQEKDHEIKRLTHQSGIYDGEISALGLEIADFKKRFENRVVEVRGIRTECEQIYEQIQGDFDGLKDEIEILRNKNTAQEDQLKNFKEKHQCLQKSVLKREESIRDKNAEIGTLEERLEQLLEKANTVQTENDMLKEDNKILVDGLQPLRDEKRWLEADILRAEEDIRDKDAQITEQAGMVEGLQAQTQYALTGCDPRWELKDWELESANEEDEGEVLV
jgi:chromosome segregation ATPase